MLSSSRWAAIALLFLLDVAISPLAAQWQSNTGPAGAVSGAIVGGDIERYLRALALAGIIKPLPWAIRPFGPVDLAEFLLDSAVAQHPWSGAMRKALSSRAAVGGVVYAGANTGFPWGANDGAMWQGRGLTFAAGAAATFRIGPLSLVAAPAAFSASNNSFDLMPQQAFGIRPEADPLFPTVIDLPQRMGSKPYRRVDPGESTVRVSGHGMSAGLSTASLGWGTGEAFPALFGSNAGGFSHLFLGTAGRGLRIPIVGRVNARYVLGVLEQSDWSPVQGSQTYVNAVQSGTRRLGTGINLSWQPGVFPNLELGASRFFHSPFLSSDRRWRAWSKPFENVFKKNFQGRSEGSTDPTGDADNQMGSFFARWVFPRRGLEATFEIFREDHNWDSRDLSQEPENNSARMASIRAVTSRRPTSLSLLTLEYFDGDVRPIAQARAQGFLYTHAGLNQGHTQRGQLLGSPIGAGAIAGQRIAWERFTPSGSLRANLQRWRTRALRTRNGEGLNPPANFLLAGSHDWIIDASLASTRYSGGRALTVEGGIAWAGNWQLDIVNESRTNLYARASWSLF